MLPLDTSVQAEYEDGYIHDETTFNDTSPYIAPWEERQNENGTYEWVFTGKNILNDILEKRPEAVHGKMVRFSVFYKDKQYDIDWTKLPDNARPIRFRHGASYLGVDGVQESEWTGMQIGYQYNDENGKNIQQVEEI